MEEVDKVVDDDDSDDDGGALAVVGECFVSSPSRRGGGC